MCNLVFFVQLGRGVIHFGFTFVFILNRFLSVGYVSKTSRKIMPHPSCTSLCVVVLSDTDFIIPQSAVSGAVIVDFHWSSFPSEAPEESNVSTSPPYTTSVYS